MADPHIQNLSIDSGQLHRLNALDSTKRVAGNLETLKSVHKQVKNPSLNNHMDIEIEEINDTRIQTGSKPVADTEKLITQTATQSKCIYSLFDINQNKFCNLLCDT